jgi:hypothetical protein
VIYEWVALYSDGGKLAQFDGDTERSFGEVDQNKLSHFALKEVGGSRIVMVDLEDGHFHIGQATDAGLVAGVEVVPLAEAANRRVIWFTRKRAILDPGGDYGSVDPYTYGWGVGWQATVEGQNVKYIAVVRSTDGGLDWECHKGPTSLKV